MARHKNGRAKSEQLKKRKDKREKLIKCIILSTFLIVITTLPSFEAINSRYRKGVDIGESPVAFQLKEGDVVEQKITLDEGDRLDDLRIWFSADIDKENKGSLQITLRQGEVLSESNINASKLVNEEYVPIHLELSRFTDGELDLIVNAAELDEDSSVSIRYAPGGGIYGIPNIVINGTPRDGALSLNFKIRQPFDTEFLVSLAMVLLIFALSILSSYVMTYTEENTKTGWMLVGLYVLLAMAVYVLQYPGKTWEGEPFAEGAVFFYDNVSRLPVLSAIQRLEGGMYLSSVQNILMIIAVKVLRLRTYVHVATQSMGTFCWIMCLAPFCSHYFKKYFARPFRFVFPLLVTCYGFVIRDCIQTGYQAAFFLLLLLIYDFEEIHNFIYVIVLALIPAICTSKMMFVVFVPVTIAYYVLFRKEMNRKKKVCIAMIGFWSLMEGVLSILLKRGVDGGHRLGTIQQVSLPAFIKKILFYTVQTFGTQLRCETLNSNQMLNNAYVIMILAGIACFVVWQIRRKGPYLREAKFVLVMFSLIIAQCAVILLTTPFWHGDVSWKYSWSLTSWHFMNMLAAASIILLIVLQILAKYFKQHLLRERLDSNGVIAHQLVTFLLLAVIAAFYINQHPGPKGYDEANPTRSSRADWKAYVSMMDSDAFCIRIEPDEWFYKRNASEKSVAIPRSTSVDLSTVSELNGKASFVFYAHKTAATNQIHDRYYYMNLYDKGGNLISRLRQLNPDPERLFIAFYPVEGITDIGHVEFTYEDGAPAFVDGTIEVGYR